MDYQIIRDIPRPSQAELAALREVPTTGLAGPAAFGPSVAMDWRIKPIQAGIRVCGPAFTAKPDGVDHLIPLYAATLLERGDVLVVDGGGRTDCALFGAGMTHTARLRGAAGVVVDGLIVDRTSIAALPIPVFCRGAHPAWSTMERPGWINIPVVCGDRVVRPGDLIHGDDDGVIVIPRERIPEAVEHARRYREQLAQWRAQVAAGRTFYEILGPDAVIARLAIPEA